MSPNSTHDLNAAQGGTFSQGRASDDSYHTQVDTPGIPAHEGGNSGVFIEEDLNFGVPDPALSSGDEEKVMRTLPQLRVLFAHLMIQPGSSGAPYFQEKNITAFLKGYENLCSDYRLSEAVMLKRLPRYCDIMTAKRVKFMLKYFIKN